MEGDKSAIELGTLYLFPVLMIAGLIVSFGFFLRIPTVLLLVVIHLMFLTFLFNLRKYPIHFSDTRFILVPIGIYLIAIVSGGYHTFPAFYDQAEYLMISNRMLERCDCGIIKQQADSLFRPEIMPGIAAIELAWTGNRYNIYVTPLVIICATGWIIQHLSEVFTSKKYSFLSSLTFLTLPVVIEYGRTMLTDVAVAGMIIFVIVIFVDNKKKTSKQMAFLGLIVACVGMTKYSYLYLGPWIALILYLRDDKSLIPSFLKSWGALISIFFVKNLIQYGGLLTPLGQQIEGTVKSIKYSQGEFGDYSLSDFLQQYVSQWEILLLFCAFCGTVLMFKHKGQTIYQSWIIILPAIVLHGLVLDFGWVRYSTPWLALASIGVPYYIQSTKPYFTIKAKIIKPFFITGVIFLLISFGNICQTLLEHREEVQMRSDVYWTIVDVYAQAGNDLLHDDILITGTSSWNLELYSTIESYQFSNTSDPVYESIIDYEATHLFTQSRGWRYSIDVNWTYLFGSPVDPFKYYWSGSTEGYLWKVNESRLDNHQIWNNIQIDFSGNVESYSDYAYLDVGADLVLPGGIFISRVVEINDGANIKSAFHAIYGGWSDSA